MPRPRRVALLLLGLAIAVAAGATHGAAQRRRDAFPPEQDLVYLPRTSLLRAASLGHPELAADLVFIRTLTYFGSQFAGDKNYEWLPRHLDAVVALDPWFLGAYRFGGLATMYNGRPISNAEVESSIHFLELGMQRFPANWDMAFMLGSNYLFELKTDDAAQKERWRHIGGNWIRRAAISGGPAWLPGLAASIMSKEGEAEAALRYLEEAYLTAGDDRTREEVRKLLVARRQSSLAGLARARDALVAGWKRTLPYAPADLYVIIGEPPSSRLDWRFLMQSDAIERALGAAVRAPATGDDPRDDAPDGGAR